MPLDEAERSRRKRDRKKELGLVPIREYGTPEQKQEVKRYLAGELKMVEVKRVRATPKPN
jgi:hypothetical protein